jgi:hypothetical protein
VLSLTSKNLEAMNNSHGFNQQQQAIMKPLINAACGCVPRAWPEAILEVTANYNEFNKTRAMSHRLTNSEGGEVRGLPEPLFLHTTALHDLFCQNGQNWKKSVVKLLFDQAGRLIRSETSFKYA